MTLYGRRIGLLGDVLKICRCTFPAPPRQPFNSVHYIDWINTLLPSFMLLHVKQVPSEPYYLYEVFLVVDRSASHRDDDNANIAYHNFKDVETLFQLQHVCPHVLEILDDN